MMAHAYWYASREKISRHNFNISMHDFEVPLIILVLAKVVAKGRPVQSDMATNPVRRSIA